MIQPCKGVTRKQLLKQYHNRIFYHLRHGYKGNGTLSISPCILSRDCDWSVDHPMVRYFDDEMTLVCYTTYACWSDLYDSWEEANKQLNHINKLYTKGFSSKPFVTIKTLEAHKGEMVKIEKLITKGLKDYENFNGINFCDVGANGIQIRGRHKQIEGYTYGKQPTIKYDFTNKDMVVSEFIEMWKAYDTPENVESFKEFLRQGEKYGWD